MNTRCYRCGWSFSLSGEALEEAAVSSAGQKAHMVHCPRCRQAISIPMDQIMRALPPGWTPAAQASAAAHATQGGQPSDQPEPETASDTTATPAAGAAERPQRRHRHSSKTNPGNSAAVGAAKDSTHPN